MKRRSGFHTRSGKRRLLSLRAKRDRRVHKSDSRPAVAYRQRGDAGKRSEIFYAQEDWHEPIGREQTEIVVQAPGAGYIHPVTAEEVRQRLQLLPARFTNKLEVVQLSRMTRKRSLFPCYGMQWGLNVYLYPLEESLVETYVRHPLPQQIIEAKMFGGRWMRDGDLWRLKWTRHTIKDFYLNNVFIHEIGHVNDDRNKNFDARERYANWFAVEYGYRRSRKKA